MVGFFSSRTFLKAWPLLLLIAAAAAGGGLYYFQPQTAALWEDIRTGRSHPAGLIAAFIFLPAAGFPIVPMLILMGLRFGALAGCLITGAIMPLHLAAAYWISRRWLHSWIRKVAQKRSIVLPELSKRHHLRVGFLFMTIPGPSYAMKNYLLPLSGMNFGTYLLCGWVPQALMSIPFIVAGHAARQWLIPLMAGLALFFCLVLVLQKWLMNTFNRLMKRAPDNANSSPASKEDTP